LVTGPAGGPLLIGVINQDELYDELPVEDHDRVVAAALSPTSITYLPTDTRHF
jgi:5-formyltetrahydrofolate cyclo-ligase